MYLVNSNKEKGQNVIIKIIRKLKLSEIIFPKWKRKMRDNNENLYWFLK